MNLLDLIEQPHLKDGIPDFAPGDTVRVNYKIREGGKFRIQPFEGVVIARRKRGTGSSFIVRKVTQGYGVERIFPLHSPLIDGIDVLRKGRVRRAKLYYLRERKGKSARIKELRK